MTQLSELHLLLPSPLAILIVQLFPPRFWIAVQIPPSFVHLNVKLVLLAFGHIKEFLLTVENHPKQTLFLRTGEVLHRRLVTFTPY